jgi:DNA-binding response OmpR family regulator
MEIAENKWVSCISPVLAGRQGVQSASRVVLIGEDQSTSVRLFCLDVSCESCRVRVAKDWKSALALAFQQNPDVVLVDAAPSALDGRQALARFCRASPGVLVIMLDLKVVGGQDGPQSHFRHDSLMANPARLAELLAATETVRSGSLKGRVERYTFGDVRLDFASLEAVKGEQPVALSPREFQILHYMIENRKRVITRSELLERVWGYHTGAHTRTIDSHIFNLRQKLEDEASEPAYIHTVHRVGYRFTG